MTLIKKFNQCNFLYNVGLIVLFLIYIKINTSFSQVVKFDHLTVKQGLPQGNVVDIFQDHLGFIWIGTEDGLNMYDGYTCTVFRNIPTDLNCISNNNIHCITEDKNGNLWVGTQSGLNFYNRKLNRFDQFLNDPEVKSSISNNNIVCLLIDSKENLWVGTADGLNLYDSITKTFKYFFVNDSTILSSAINTILEDSNKQIWIGTMHGGLRLLNNDGTSTSFLNDPKDPTTLSSNKITKMIEDQNHNLWIGTVDGGLNKRSLSQKKFVVPPYWQSWWFRSMIALVLLYSIHFYLLQNP